MEPERIPSVLRTINPKESDTLEDQERDGKTAFETVRPSVAYLLLILLLLLSSSLTTLSEIGLYNVE
jgi:hypothetical protein